MCFIILFISNKQNKKYLSELMNVESKSDKNNEIICAIYNGLLWLPIEPVQKIRIKSVMTTTNKSMTRTPNEEQTNNFFSS